ncbi:MAG: hypothetical protein IPH12_06915 [Saprospirales bacterium]|nr:hypothetical protein [Saprospirales bacterium]
MAFHQKILFGESGSTWRLELEQAACPPEAGAPLRQWKVAASTQRVVSARGLSRSFRWAIKTRRHAGNWQTADVRRVDRFFFVEGSTGFAGFLQDEQDFLKTRGGLLFLIPKYNPADPEKS